jgi:HSP20 family protein
LAWRKQSAGILVEAKTPLEIDVQRISLNWCFSKALPALSFGRLRDDLERFFGTPYEASTDLWGWGPAVDLYEDKDRFTVKCELPGIKKEDIDISVEGNTLCICGERNVEQEEKPGEAYHTERYYGRFTRNITLPQAVNAGKVNATYKDGILTISLPKTEESKRKQIQIQAEGVK